MCLVSEKASEECKGKGIKAINKKGKQSKW
jgi:hypothetical protein